MMDALPVNAGSNAGPAPAKESEAVRDEKERQMREWAQNALPATIQAVKDLTRKIESPDTKGEDRKKARRERTLMMGRIKAMQRLLVD